MKSDWLIHAHTFQVLQMALALFSLSIFFPPVGRCRIEPRKLALFGYLSRNNTGKRIVDYLMTHPADLQQCKHENFHCD